MAAVRERSGHLEVPCANEAMRNVTSQASQWLWAIHGEDPRSPQLLEALRREQEQFLAGLAPTSNQVRALRRREAGWNGYDALPPDPKAIWYADSWIREFYREVISAGQTWRRPHVTSSAEGEVVFEWWNGQKELTVYISAEAAFSVKSSGADPDTEMEEGDAAPATSRRQLWAWLTS